VTQTSEATEPAAAEKSAARKKSGGLSSMLLPELKQLASSLGIKGAGSMRKSALVDAISSARASSPDRGDTTAPTTALPAVDSGQRWQRPQTESTVSPPPSGAESTPAPFGSVSTSANGAVEPTPPPFSPTDVTDDSDGGDPAPARTHGRPDPARGGDDSTTAVSGANGDSRDGGRDRQQNRESRVDQAVRSQDRNNRTRASSGRPDNAQDRDGTQQGRDGTRDGQQGRDNGRDGGQRDNSSGRDGYRDDERGGGRNSRRRNRNRDRFRDRDKRRDGNESEPQVSEDDVLIPAAGILDLLDNYAFVRTSGYLPGPNDVYVALSMVRKYGLRKGDAVTGAVRQQASDGERREKFNPMVRIDTVNGAEPEASKNRIEFSKLTPLYAQERLRLETEPNIIATRIIDIVAPIGKGQRGLIVSPSKAGKTLILQAMANAITTNNPECHLMVVLVDERPEEVTDMQRAVKGEVIASTFDRPAEDHTTVAELAIERAKRLVELGHDVVVLLDSITRLGRAYNLAAPASGRILSGGVDSSALYPPKRFFGAARNIEDGGSLTILATALIETGSKMDEVIFEEFKGTGNMELRLRREYADKRIFPAIDVDASGTRREDLLMSKDELQIVWKLRRVLSALEGQQALELLLEKLRQTKSNVEFLMQVNKTTPTASGLRNSGED
jgi:transcription termination factor Rho